jgi:hypothetical protein
MDQYVGLDVSLKQTWISVRQNRKRIWRGKCLSHPRAVADAIRQHAPNAVLVVFETGALATWFHHALTAEGLPAVCIDARHAKAALDTAPNKTDANDADGLALLAEAGFFREVRVKSWEAMPVRTLVGGRAQLIAISNDLSNQIRGIMKTFGLAVPKGGGRSFETNVRALLEGQAALACGACSNGKTRPATRGGGTQEPSLSVVDDGSRGRHDHRAVVHDHDRGPGELCELARGGGFCRPNNAELSIGRGRLRRAHLAPRRQARARSALRGRDGGADPRPLRQRVATLGSQTEGESWLQARGGCCRPETGGHPARAVAGRSRL